MTNERLLDAMDEAEKKAIDSLTRYKFHMFGYWSAIWVHLNHLSDLRKPNPFRAVVLTARLLQIGHTAQPVTTAGPPPAFICANCGPIPELDPHAHCPNCGSDHIVPNHAPTNGVHP